MPQPLWKACLAEAIGTFTLIFIGAGSIIANQLSGGKVGVVGIAFAHGLAIATMVAAAGHISGGHFNPAVTAVRVCYWPSRLGYDGLSGAGTVGGGEKTLWKPANRG